jgi:hypothetical protein
MIKRIISGGQTGAERAALDVAIKFNIPHGGWIPKGCNTENNPLSDKYQLQEFPTHSYQAGIEKNVLEADGTLTFSRGAPSGQIKYARKIALQYKRHFLFINLNKTITYDASFSILSWVKQHNIENLNVAGQETPEDEKMYSDVFRTLEMAYVMHKAERLKSDKHPKTMEAAIDRLTKALSLKEKTTLANMAETKLSTLHFNLGEYIRNEFCLWSGNVELMASCRLIAKRADIHQDEATSMIIKELWKRLRQTHRLRVVK